MPSCVVTGCKNRSEQKVKMCFSPEEPILRNEWIKKINRSCWTPTKLSAVCQYHFNQSMWEKPREDGKIKIKYNAVPTIFGQRVFRVGKPTAHLQSVENLFYEKDNAYLNAADEQSPNENDHTSLSCIDESTSNQVSAPQAPNQNSSCMVSDERGELIQRIFRVISEDVLFPCANGELHKLNSINFGESLLGDESIVSLHRNKENPHPCSTCMAYLTNQTDNPDERPCANNNVLPTYSVMQYQTVQANSTNRNNVSDEAETVVSNNLNSTSDDHGDLRNLIDGIVADDESVCSSIELCDEEDIQKMNQKISVLAQNYPRCDPVEKLGYRDKMRKLEKVCLKSREVTNNLKSQLIQERKQRKQLSKKVNYLEEQVGVVYAIDSPFRKFLAKDQIELLARNYKKLPKWCDGTSVKAYRLKFAVVVQATTS
ncbi:hypothetical protein QAD02_007933 [Eretmocerus hayati]|uniref:Uncharacterized protein n=1 Tax=Eretmocerus hayati TaxID=131215 RepID=A0ACC2N5V3_9HYME|nr:hypothetical protein QAD02_007933 [Eretmocerus hayati]